MVLLENDEFLSQLTKMFQKARPTGSVLMTIKKYDGRTKPKPREGKEDNSPNLNLCIVRATSKNNKITTIVDKNEVAKFHAAYSNLLRGNIDGLKKIKKTKNKGAIKNVRVV